MKNLIGIVLFISAFIYAVELNIIGVVFCSVFSALFFMFAGLENIADRIIKEIRRKG